MSAADAPVPASGELEAGYTVLVGMSTSETVAPDGWRVLGQAEGSSRAEAWKVARDRWPGDLGESADATIHVHLVPLRSWKVITVAMTMQAKITGV